MKIGLESVQESPRFMDKAGRVALLCNQASLTQDLDHASQLLNTMLGERLTCFFGPQHGFFGTEQDNMIETPHSYCPYTRKPIYSLYSELRAPSATMLESVDTIVLDLQNTGCRVYTFKYTMAACLRVAQKYDKKVLVLDRPNPLGGVLVEGPTLPAGLRSFVGEFPIPMRHGLTLGEMALYFNQSIGAELEIVPLKNWNPKDFWPAERPWLPPSPNLPNMTGVYLYPGMVLFEGTMISEGRGTTLPFQLLGHPLLKDCRRLIERTCELAKGHQGFRLLPSSFRPTSNKHQNTVCHGVLVTVQDPGHFNAFFLGCCLLRAFYEQLGNDFRWKGPPYEYEEHLAPIDLISGIVDFQEKIAHWPELCRAILAAPMDYIAQAQKILLYPREMLVMGAQPTAERLGSLQF